jgi:Putative addiction module component
MNTARDDTIPAALIEAALMLPQAAKDKLAKLLTEPTEPYPPFEISHEWRDEIARRVEAVRSGQIGTIPAAESIARLRRLAAEGANE